MGSFRAPDASKDAEAMPQMIFTTRMYSTANLARAATSQAAICRPSTLLSVPAISRSSTTNTVLPTIMAGTVTAWGAMFSRKASTGETTAMTMPLLIPATKEAMASTALTQEPVTIWPKLLVTDCSTISMASSRAVSVIQRIFLFIAIPLFS